MKSLRISDLYLMRIAESEGDMQLIRDGERKTGKQLGTVVIIDLDGLSLDKLDWKAIKVITNMISDLQELFPDVLRKLYIIRAPSFLQLLWSAIVPYLAKQTQQKIEFLGNNWKIKLNDDLGQSLLYKHWGGTRESDNGMGEFGNIRMGGKVPKEMYYSYETDPFYDVNKIQLISLPARQTIFIDIEFKENESKMSNFLHWWWQCESGDVDFYIDYLSQLAANNHSENQLFWPKLRLLTEFVPESRKVPISKFGTYRLYFGNKHGKFWTKRIKYRIEIV